MNAKCNELGSTLIHEAALCSFLDLPGRWSCENFSNLQNSHSLRATKRKDLNLGEQMMFSDYNFYSR